MKTFRFKLLTQEQVLFDGQVQDVHLPTQQGEITVLAKHMPLIATCKPGTVTFSPEATGGTTEGDVVTTYNITRGTLDVRPNGDVIVLCTIDNK